MPNPILRARATPRGGGHPLEDLVPVAQQAALALHHAAKRPDGTVDEDALRDLVDALGLRTRTWPAGKCRVCGRELTITSTSSSRNDKISHGHCSITCTNAANRKGTDA